MGDWLHNYKLKTEVKFGLCLIYEEEEDDGKRE